MGILDFTENLLSKNANAAVSLAAQFDPSVLKFPAEFVV